MINKARQNRINTRVAALTVTQKAKLLMGLDGYYAEGGESGGLNAARGESGVRVAKKSRSVMPQYDGGVVFPSASALGCSFDKELVREVAAAVASECREKGINLLLGPGASIGFNPLEAGACARFSEDAVLCGSLAAAYVNGLRDGGITGCLTDFGGVVGGNCSTDMLVDESVLQDQYLESWRIAVRDGSPAAVMCADNKVNGSFIWQSEELIKKSLRGRMGFDGAVFAPYGGTCDAIAALERGCDISIPANKDEIKFLNALQQDAEGKQLVDAAAAHACYLSQESLKEAAVGGSIPRERRRLIAARAARECMVLLKNDDGLLPFDTEGDIAIIGSYAAHPHTSLPGVHGIKAENEPSLLDAFDTMSKPYIYAAGYNLDGSTNPGLVSEAKSALAKAGRGILVVGQPEGEENDFSDSRSMKLPDGILKLADFLLSMDIPLAIVIMTGSAVELPFASRAKAMLYTGFCGETQCEGAANILLGRTNPTGRLAFSWPERAEDLPESLQLKKDGISPVRSEGELVGYKYFDRSGVKPLFRFGWGLSYTALKFHGGECDRKVVVGERQKVTLTYKVQNIGDRPVRGTLQFYVARRGETVRRLVDFEKLHMLPGETRIVKTELPDDLFTRFDAASGRRRMCAGEYVISVASASGAAATLGYYIVTAAPRDGFTMESAAQKTAQELISAYGSDTERDRYTKDRFSTLSEIKGTFAGRGLYESINVMLTQDKNPLKEKYFAYLEKLPIWRLPAATNGCVSRKKVNGVEQLLSGNAVKGIIDVLSK